jgi:hypothetical protein
MGRPKGIPCSDERKAEISRFFKGKRKEACQRGHSTTEENTYILPSGRKGCRVCLRENHRKCRSKPDRWEHEKARIREFVLERKIEILTHYGPSKCLGCCWSECTVTDVDMLSLDHIQNDGAEHRRSMTHETAGSVAYAWVKRHNFPEGFQTLCHNHQWKKEIQRRRDLQTQ